MLHQLNYRFKLNAWSGGVLRWSLPLVGIHIAADETLHKVFHEKLLLEEEFVAVCGFKNQFVGWHV